MHLQGSDAALAGALRIAVATCTPSDPADVPKFSALARARRFIALTGAMHSAYELVVLPTGYAWRDAWASTGGAPSVLLPAALTAFIALHVALFAGFAYGVLGRH